MPVSRVTFRELSTSHQQNTTSQLRHPATSTAKMAAQDGPKLLWNHDNVKDVAESIGISLAEEPLRLLTQDVEFRIGQVIVEALRFMRAANRTILTVQDVSQALRVLDVEPLYGYESTRPLRYGEASLGPGQPLFYIDDEEVDFEKLINAPLPKVPRDMSFTGGHTSVNHFNSSFMLTLSFSSPLARCRGRPTLHPSEPHHRRIILQRPSPQGPRRQPRTSGPRGQRQCLLPTICEARHKQGARLVLR